MAGKIKAAPPTKVSPDLTPMIDVCFLLITFFVMLTTLAKEDASQELELPTALSAPLQEEQRIPDSIYLKVLPGGILQEWGYNIDLNEPKGVELFTNLMKKQARLIRKAQGLKESDNLKTTAVIRIDRRQPARIFIKVIEVCQQAGFINYQVKALPKEA